MCGPGTKMAAALSSFSDKTSAWSGDKHQLWRGTEEEAAQITTATIAGFRGAGRSQGHCLAVVSYFVLLLKVFLGCGWHFSEQRRGKSLQIILQSSPSCVFGAKFQIPQFPPPPPRGKKRRREGTTVLNRRKRSQAQTHFMHVKCDDATQERVTLHRWFGEQLTGAFHGLHRFNKLAAKLQ